MIQSAVDSLTADNSIALSKKFDIVSDATKYMIIAAAHLAYDNYLKGRKSIFHDFYVAKLKKTDINPIIDDIATAAIKFTSINHAEDKKIDMNKIFTQQHKNNIDTIIENEDTRFFVKKALRFAADTAVLYAVNEYYPESSQSRLFPIAQFLTYNYHIITFQYDPDKFYKDYTENYHLRSLECYDTNGLLWQLEELKKKEFKDKNEELDLKYKKFSELYKQVNSHSEMENIIAPQIKSKDIKDKLGLFHTHNDDVEDQGEETRTKLKQVQDEYKGSTKHVYDACAELDFETAENEYKQVQCEVMELAKWYNIFPSENELFKIRRQFNDRLTEEQIKKIRDEIKQAQCKFDQLYLRFFPAPNQYLNLINT